MARWQIKAALVLVVVTMTTASCSNAAAPVSTPALTSAVSVSSSGSAPSVTIVAPGRLLLPAPSDAPLDSAVTDALQRQLDDWVASGAAPGVTAAVVSAQGTWSGAAGADGAGQPLVPGAMMGIGSVTKTFVAAEVMLLAERGLVDLDAPLTDYLDIPFTTSGATVRQVLHMISGFPDLNYDNLTKLAVADLHRIWTAEEVLALVDPKGIRSGLFGVTLGYNNINFILLGMLIETVTGHPYSASLNADLLDPAGLDRLVVQPDEVPRQPVARPVPDPQGNPPPLDGPHLASTAIASQAGSAGGMAGDAPTLARWIYLLYGGHIINADLVEQMTAGTEDDWYGLGTLRGYVDGQLWVGHNGNIDGYHCVAFVGTADAVSVAVLVPQIDIPSAASGMTIGELGVELHRAVAEATGASSSSAVVTATG